jgi:hypothetical protein
MIPTVRTMISTPSCSNIKLGNHYKNLILPSVPLNLVQNSEQWDSARLKQKLRFDKSTSGQVKLRITNFVMEFWDFLQSWHQISCAQLQTSDRHRNSQTHHRQEAPLQTPQNHNNEEDNQMANKLRPYPTRRPLSLRILHHPSTKPHQEHNIKDIRDYIWHFWINHILLNAITR